METPSLDADLLPVPRGLECPICLELMQDLVAKSVNVKLPAAAALRVPVARL